MRFLKYLILQTETVDLWKLPGKDERPPATLGVPLRTITLSISSVTQRPVLLKHNDGVAFGIPRDDSFYISEDDEHHYTVTLTNNMRELINTTHVIKSVGRLEESNSFYAVAKRRDTSNMTE